MTGRSGETGGVIEFGPKRLEFIPYQAINELPQVRTVYDEGAINDLAQAIQSGREGSSVSSDDFELANPVLMGRHSPQSAKKYIADHGDYYRIASRERMDYQDLTPLPSDHESAVISIAGHRRRRAIGRLIEVHNIDPATARVASNVRDEIEFGQAIGLQLRENVYERPSPQDEARAIDLSYRYNLEKLGYAPNIRKLSQQLGFSETKVREALQFASLPASIQEYTASGALSYSVVRQLKSLHDAFLTLYKEEAPAVRAMKAELGVREFCDAELKKQLSGKSEQKISLTIFHRTKEILGQADYQQLSFDLLVDEHTVERRADRAGRQLATTALAVMRYRLRLGEIKDTEVQELETLLAAHREAQIERTPVELTIPFSEAS